MSRPEPTPRKSEETPVDDVRRVREQLSKQFDNDVDKLADHARKVTEEYREKLGLKRFETERSKDSF